MSTPNKIEIARNITCSPIQILLNDTFQHSGPNPMEWICFIYASITIPIHLVVLYAVGLELYKNRRNNNSFYQICLTTGIIDIICLVNNYTFYSFTRWRWSSLTYVLYGDFAMHIGFCISWGLGIGQLILTLMMTINRFTAILHPTKHDNFWRGNRTFLIIMLSLLFSLGFGSFIFLSPVCAMETENGDVLIKMLSVQILTIIVIFAGLFTIIGTGAMVIMYLIIFISLSRRNKTANRKKSIVRKDSLTKPNQMRQEYKLLIMSSIICLIFVLIIIFIMAKFLMGKDHENVVYNQINAIYSTTNTYLIIVFSGLIRKRLRQLFWFIPQKTQTIVANSINMSRKSNK